MRDECRSFEIKSVSCEMEGYMNKWTNYILGWKPRYFMLNQGVLSYYLSCEEVGAGCRGSIQVFHCRTVSHPYDDCRLEILLPSKRCIYLRASTPSERQQWLVALANAKMEADGRKLEVGANTWVDKNVDVRRLKDKRIELEANRQQLQRQMSALKTEIEAVANSKTDELKRVQSVSLLISATCDNALSTLDECISITSVMLTESVDGSEPLGTPSYSPFLPRLPLPRSQNSQRTSVTSHEVTENIFPSPPSYLHPLNSLTHSNSTIDVISPTPSSCYEACVTHLDGTVSPPQDAEALLQSLINSDTLLAPICQRIGFMVIPSQPDKVQVDGFLDTCSHIPTLVIQLFGSVATHLKTDILGNIKKIEAKHGLLNKEHTTLNGLILAEIRRAEHKADKSATIGLLWLKRSLHFIQKFLSGLTNDRLDPAKAAEIAYEASLMPHHNWVVRSVFPIILKAASMSNIHATFCKNDTSKESLVHSQMEYISQELSRTIAIIDELYIMNSLM